MNKDVLGPLTNLIGTWKWLEYYRRTFNSVRATTPQAPRDEHNVAISQFKIFQLETQKMNETIFITSAPEVSLNEAAQ